VRFFILFFSFLFFVTPSLFYRVASHLHKDTDRTTTSRYTPTGRSERVVFIILVVLLVIFYALWILIQPPVLNWLERQYRRRYPRQSGTEAQTVQLAQYSKVNDVEMGGFSGDERDDNVVPPPYTSPLAAARK
jgi:hypothetical protein